MSQEATSDSPSRSEALQAGTLGVWDTASLLIGIVVGTAIFRTPSDVFSLSGNPATAMLIWGLGGVLALCGALCYCELATTYPNFGAEYAYLSRAYGKRTGFLFAWMQLCVILTGSIGAMAFVFADYAGSIVDDLESKKAISAAVALLTLTVLHLFGVQTGKTVQNILTVAKILALGTILCIGVFSTANVEQIAVAPEQEPYFNIGLALVFVLYAYGGWNDAAMVTPEVRDYRKNMPRALLLGLGLIALLYLALNATFLKVLGYPGLSASKAPATDVVALAMDRSAANVMSIIVMMSALGAIHGMFFASSRLLAAVGEDFPIFARWNRWTKTGVPMWSLLTITAITLVLILAVGTERGQQLTTQTATAMWLPKPDWEYYDGGFNTLVAATAPVFWLFFGLSGFGLIVLRFTDPERERPFRVPFYPVIPLIFFGSAMFMLWKSLDYAKSLTLLSLPVFALGLFISLIAKKTNGVTTES